jgi:hypothetical protein
LHCAHANGMGEKRDLSRSIFRRAWRENRNGWAPHRPSWSPSKWSPSISTWMGSTSPIHFDLDGLHIARLWGSQHALYLATSGKRGSHRVAFLARDKISIHAVKRDASIFQSCLKGSEGGKSEGPETSELSARASSKMDQFIHKCINAGRPPG